MKDLFIEAHEMLVEEYLDRHPEATWEEAYDRTASLIEARAADLYAAMIDQARMESKYG